MTLDSLRHELLAARDARAAAIARLSAAVPAGGALVVLSLNVPGPGKTSPRLDRLFGRARHALTHRAGAPDHTEEGRDALGPWMAAVCAGDPREVKRWCVAIEEELPAGRLVDLDVFGRGVRQVDRSSLGLPPRRCLACSEAAVDCIRSRRHTLEELSARVERLLHRAECAQFGEALVEGARMELELTPKPGLVDRRDNGSHPDLTFELMERSVSLLPEYYDDLLACRSTLERPFNSSDNPSGPSPDAASQPRCEPVVLQACIAAGRRAEQRMLERIGTNAHRGYIFLSGLALLGFARSLQPEPAATGPASARMRGPAGLSSAIAQVAQRVLDLRETPAPSHGEGARRRHGVGGILAEAVNGLPSIFHHALPALERREAMSGGGDAARHVAMATLMTVVEDTTTLHRCGVEGLERLRRDGRRILHAVEERGDYAALLSELNDQYRAVGMTMGGVADCLALTIGLRLAAGG